jgi:hypothetical protein
MTLAPSLTEKDYEILNLLYVEGCSIPAIAKVVGLDRRYIISLLDRQEVQPLINEFIKANEAELLGLEMKATEVLRAHMDSDSEDIQNKAVDKIYRRNGKYKETKDVHVTIEDVLRTFLTEPSATETEDDRPEAESEKS